jgi:hypothetical protein
MTEPRTLTIVITPAPPSDLRSLFSEHPKSIRRELENPPELRPNGWGLRTGASARSIDGEFIQTESFREVINLYRDGQFVVASRIDRNSIAWSDKKDARIHPLAFVEFVTNTLMFYRLVLADMSITPQSLHVEVRLGNLTPTGETTTLPAGGINNMGRTFGEKSAPAPAWSRTITVDAATYDATRTAFLLLREVYVWFGHTDEDVPYTKGIGDDRMVDTAAIISIN